MNKKSINDHAVPDAQNQSKRLEFVRTAKDVLVIRLLEYYKQTKPAVRLTDLRIGLFRSAVFGAIVAMAGSFQGEGFASILRPGR
jgi:hypothetical protein